MSKEIFSSWKSPSLKPKSGKYVLVTVRDGKRVLVLRAYWIAKFTEINSEYEGAQDYSEEKDEYYCPEGWYESNEYEDTNWRVTGTVLAWMPLPEPYQEEF